MPTCLIALGGNLGQVEQTFDRALAQLAQHSRVHVTGVSSRHSTVPVGQHAGQPFLNAAARLQTDLPALDLLDELQRIETALGRTRELRWGPRTLDLDLICYGQEQIDVPRLQVPHPACWYRRFVLDPLAELAPEFVHPAKQVTFQVLHARLLPRPFRLQLAGGSNVQRRQAVTRLSADFPNVEIADWNMVDWNCAEWNNADSNATDGSAAKADAVEWDTVDGGPLPHLIAWLGPQQQSADTPTPIGSEMHDAPRSRPCTFEDLPLLPRLDISLGMGGDKEVVTVLHDILTAALG